MLKVHGARDLMVGLGVGHAWEAMHRAREKKPRGKLGLQVGSLCCPTWATVMVCIGPEMGLALWGLTLDLGLGLS